MKLLALQNASVLSDGEYMIGSLFLKDKLLMLPVDLIEMEQIYESNMTDAQKWRVIHAEEGYVTFINVGSGKALDVTCESSLPGTNVQQYALNNSKAQKWIVLMNDNGTYTIKSAIGVKYCRNYSGELL